MSNARVSIVFSEYSILLTGSVLSYHFTEYVLGRWLVSIETIKNTSDFSDGKWKHIFDLQVGTQSAQT